MNQSSIFKEDRIISLDNGNGRSPNNSIGVEIGAAAGFYSTKLLLPRALFKAVASALGEAQNAATSSSVRLTVISSNAKEKGP